MVFLNKENKLFYQKAYDLKIKEPVNLTSEFHKVFATK